MTPNCPCEGTGIYPDRDRADEPWVFCGCVNEQVIRVQSDYWGTTNIDVEVEEYTGTTVTLRLRPNTATMPPATARRLAALLIAKADEAEKGKTN